MSSAAQELVEIVESLPEEKTRAVLDFARFLRCQAGDQEWERILADETPKPKLDAFVEHALHEEPAPRMDPSTL